MSNLQINTRVRRLFQYLEDFEKGRIQVPPFQRDFVWANEKKLDLLDSLKNGFPIGSVLFWKPDPEISFDIVDDELQSIGTYHLPTKTERDFYFILDGYQRLSTLFGCFIDPNKTILKRNEPEWKKNYDIVYNLKENKFEFNRKQHTVIQIFQIPLYHFIDGAKFYDFQTDLMNASIEDGEKKDYISRYKSFGSKISSYDIPSIDLVGGSIKEAVDIFSRLNSKGESISDDWKVSALSFSRERNFRFGSEIDKLFKRLERFNFFTINTDRKSKRDLILQCVVNSFGKFYIDVSSVSNELENLALRPEFIDVSLKVFVSIEKAVKFLFEHLLMLDSRLLPYNNQLIFITDFFNKWENPSETQFIKLKKWFWVTTYSNYFTIYNLSKQRLAYRRFQDFILDESINPIYYDKHEPFSTIEFPKKISMGSVRAKALALYMLNYSVTNNDILSISRYGLQNIHKYRILRLFKHLKEPEEINISENTVLIIEPLFELTIADQNGDDFILFLEKKGDTAMFFISEDMKKRFLSNSSKEELLKERLALIKANEKYFVEKLNMKYQE